MEYYFSKGFGILECNSNNLTKITNLYKKRIHAEETQNSDYVMTFIITITSISNTIFSYIQTEFNDKEEITNITLIMYVEPLLNDTIHPELIQERKLNIDSAAYKN